VSHDAGSPAKRTVDAEEVFQSQLFKVVPAYPPPALAVLCVRDVLRTE
jgi:hypothetical protein